MQVKSNIKKRKINIAEFIEEHISIIIIFTTSIIALIARIKITGNITDFDYLRVEKWFNDLKKYGGLVGLKYYEGYYNYPYIILLGILTHFFERPKLAINGINIIFDFILAITCSKITLKVFSINKDKKLYSILTYIVVLFIPTVLLNGHVLGQCDVIYTTFIVISLLYLLEEKYFRAFIFLGISFAFKLQFIFILPAYIIIYFSKKNFSILNFLIIPIMNFLLCIIALFNGKTFFDITNVYKNQIDKYDQLSLNLPNLYYILKSSGDFTWPYDSSGTFATAGMIITITIFIVAILAVIYCKKEFNKHEILLLCVWSVSVFTFFMPKMHERYLFVADVLSVLYFIVSKDMKKIYIPIIINFISLYMYSNMIFGIDVISIQIISALNLSIIVLLTVEVFKSILKQDYNILNLNE